MKELYKQEIIELTELLNEDEQWEDLKNILIESKMDISKIALVSFMEDDDENEYGVIVSNDLIVYKYERKTQEGKNNIDNFTMVDITENEDELKEYPQIAIAIEMINSGEILKEDKR